jgi:hypothetical protein
MTDSYLKFAVQNRTFNLLRKLLLPLFLMLCFALAGAEMHAQVMNYNNNITNTTDPNQQQSNNLFNQGKDSAAFKSDSEWKDEQAKIHFNYLNSAVARYADSSISFFHRYQITQPWWGKNLGNYGTAVRNEMFTPKIISGLSLGYNAYDLYKLTLDNLAFYNTTRPYSSFSFMLGSKNEQNVEILHTQNISPNWNIAAKIRYLSSEGFFQKQKANNIGGSLSTNYQSTNQRYYMAAGFVYNKFKQDENGGIKTNNLDSFLSSGNRQLMEVNLPGRKTNSTLPAVSNSLRDWTFYIQNNYSIGQSDTLYNKDSTLATYRFTPRFRFKHQLEMHAERHVFKDLFPDSIRYAQAGLANIEKTKLSQDTMFSAQNWFYIDNKFSLNGFLGKKTELVQIEAGIANRVDNFSTDYVIETDKQSNVSNYLFGEIKKEAFAEGQWEYKAAAKFIFTGPAVGNFDINASVGKDLKKWGQFSGGLTQSLNNAPYSWTIFKTKFYERSYDLDKTSITQLWANVNIKRIELQLGIRNYLISNYLYYGSDLTVHQQSEAFSLLQVYGRKDFTFGIFALDNEVVWQQPTGGAPVNVPAVLLRHQFRLETLMFRKALKVALGLEARYHTPYFADGYTPYFNQFYLQNTQKISNAPECSAFFNFKIKSFRAFVLGDQLQQFFTRNVINAPGYPAQNALFRFGFNWILIN